MNRKMVSGVAILCATILTTIAVAAEAQGPPALARSWSVEEYIRRAGPVLVQRGFFEREIGRATELFGNIGHVFSTYESRNTREGEIIQRGINSIQLFNDGERWWIMNIMWDSERPDSPIPEEYVN